MGSCLSSSSGKMKLATTHVLMTPPPHSRSPSPPLTRSPITPEEHLTYAIERFRFKGAPRPALPYMRPSGKNLDIVTEINELLVPYLRTSTNVVDTHILLYCGAAAACKRAGLKLTPVVQPILQARMYEPLLISERRSWENFNWPLGNKTFLSEKGYKYGTVICSMHHQFTTTRPYLIDYIRRYNCLNELRFEGTWGMEKEVELNSPNLRPVYDDKARPRRSLELHEAGWDLSDSSIWMELGIIQNAFQTPFWFCPSRFLVADLLKISKKGENLHCEAEIILHLLPAEASYRLLAVKKRKVYYIVILKIIEYYTDDLEENFFIEKCAVIQVDIQTSKDASTLRLFTKKTLRGIGMRDAYRRFNTKMPKSRDNQEPVDCAVIYDREKDNSMMICRPKSMRLTAKRVKELQERYKISKVLTKLRNIKPDLDVAKFRVHGNDYALEVIRLR